MHQQINLYIRRQKVKVPFSALSCLLIVALSVLVLSAVWGYNEYGLSRLQSDMTALKQEQQRLQSSYDQVRKKLVVIEESPALKSELAAMERQIVARKQFEQLLDGLQSDQTVAFSSMLQGLSGQIIDGLWLTRIQAGGDVAAGTLNLEGGTLKPELVPRYLKRLGEDAAWQRAQFDQLQLQQADSGLSFQVSARLQAGDR